MVPLMSGQGLLDWWIQEGGVNGLDLTELAEAVMVRCGRALCMLHLPGCCPWSTCGMGGMSL